MAKQFKPETLCVQAGWTPKKGEPRVLPIYQSTTFKYDTSEQMARLFDLEDSGYFYTRLQNPTNDAVAAKIAALEGGVAAMLTSSGQAANFYAIFNICQAGDHFVCSSTIYGGTFNLFGVTLKKLGIDVTFVNPDASEEEISAAFRPNTKALFGETISNPTLEVLDIEKFARIAHSHGVPLIVDNTFPTPINCRPFEWGADIVVHSTTKYMDGHATSVGGAIVDSGNFDWDAHADKFPGLCTPDESYHGLTYTKAFGKMAYITKATAQLMRDLGSIQSPQNAFLLNLGLETLHLRMPQHCKNAQAVAEYLAQNDKVAWVNYCGLPGDKYYEQAQKYMPNGSCGVVTFGLKGGREESIKFMDSLKLAAIVTHVADARTCVLHPASHTHRQLTDEQLMEAGVRPDLIRFSVGIEKFARIAHSHGVPLIVDNTFPTPINCRPFEWGADIVVHSTTKYMDGHATSVGGAIVDSGNFDWDAHADKFPGLCTPDESYHGLTYTKAFGKMAYITKATAQLMRDLGSIQSPQNAFLLNLGLETLHLRMPQHCKNAQAVAEYLAQNDKVAWVNYCGLPGDKYYEQAQKYMPNGSCGVVTFGLKGGREESIKFMDSLKLAAIVTHVADARTCVLHPASHTHRQLTDEQLMEAGVRPDLIRFSVGIENAEDIIADIEQALNA